MSEENPATEPATGDDADTTAAEPTTTTDAKPDAPATGDTTDWKAEARKWEKRAKENSKAADELEKAKQASMSDTDKAISEAEKKGRAAAAADYGRQLAQAKFEAAAATKGIALGEAAEFIDFAKFVDAKTGEVDEDAIKAAVGKFAKSAPKAGATRSGGEFNGGTGAGAPITEEQLSKMTPEQISKAYGEGRLKHLM